MLTDIPTSKNGRHSLNGQFRQSPFGRVAGHEGVNDLTALPTAEQWIKEGNNAVKWACLPRRSMQANAARL
jgi:hypothetical protein